MHFPKSRLFHKCAINKKHTICCGFLTIKSTIYSVFFTWRRERDLNPCIHSCITRFRIVRVRPLRHLCIVSIIYYLKKKINSFYCPFQRKSFIIKEKASDFFKPSTFFVSLFMLLRSFGFVSTTSERLP